MMLQFLGNILMISPFPFLEKNQIVVAQNAADDLSPLDCTPECPQVFLYLLPESLIYLFARFLWIFVWCSRAFVKDSECRLEKN